MKYLFIYIYKYVCIYKCLIVLWVYKYIIYMIIVDCVSSLLSHDRCITMWVGMNMLLICGILIILSTRKLLIYIQPLYCHTRLDYRPARASLRCIVLACCTTNYIQGLRGYLPSVLTLLGRFFDISYYAM